MKTCFKCGETKPLSEFYAHPRMRDGRLNKCTACTRKDVQENRVARIGHYRAYDRARCTEERHRSIALSHKRHHDHHRARVTVHNALRRGTLVRRPCEVCNDPKTEAHHTDYARPLDVRWLCRKHHGMAHRMDADRRGEFAATA